MQKISTSRENRWQHSVLTGVVLVLQAPGNSAISEQNQGVLDWDKQKR
jgi:hypothetical protein